MKLGELIKGADQEGNDREDYFLLAGYDPGGLHPDQPFLLAGEEFHYWRLDNRHQGHIGVGGDSNGAEKIGSKHRRKEDSGWPVGSADYTDGPGLGRCESQEK